VGELVNFVSIALHSLTLPGPGGESREGGCVLSPWLQPREMTRETREGWPSLLTVETGENGDSKSTNERSCSLGLLCGTRDFCSALAALAGQVRNICFLTVHYFDSFVPTAQHPVQTAVLGRLSLSTCLWR
jgi:hypothetical protein